MSNIIADWKLIYDFMADTFKAVGVPDPDAEICADVIMESDRRGIPSHGINRFKPLYFDRIKQGIQHPVTNFEIVKKTMTTAVVDAHDGMGQVVGYKAMSLAVDMAKQYGMGMVAVRNSTHYGIAGYYTTMASKAGCIGVSGTNTRPSVAPTFGTEGMLGTNPLSFSMPTDEDFPFTIDCATSVIPMGKVELYNRLGKPLPDGLIVNPDGECMTDPAEILAAHKNGDVALVTLGGVGEEQAGYKGYGYSAVVEILSAALQAGSYLKMLSGSKDGKAVPFRLGHFFIAMDTNAFEGEESFKKTAGNILRELRASRKAKGCDRIFTAGEKEWLVWQETKDRGVSVTPSVMGELIAIRNELGLTQYKFPTE